jgi:hypothetical protein
MATTTSRLLALDSSALLQTYVRSLGPNRTQALPTDSAPSPPCPSSKTLGPASLSAILNTTTLPIHSDSAKRVQDHAGLASISVAAKQEQSLPSIARNQEAQPLPTTNTTTTTTTTQADHLPPVFRAALDRCALLSSTFTSVSPSSPAATAGTFTVLRHSWASRDQVHVALGRYTSLAEANAKVVSVVLAGDAYRTTDARAWEVKVLEGGRMDVVRWAETGSVRVWVEEGEGRAGRIVGDFDVKM